MAGYVVKFVIGLFGILVFACILLTLLGTTIMAWRNLW